MNVFCGHLVHRTKLKHLKSVKSSNHTDNSATLSTLPGTLTVTILLMLKAVRSGRYSKNWCSAWRTRLGFKLWLLTCDQIEVKKYAKSRPVHVVCVIVFVIVCL